MKGLLSKIKSKLTLRRQESIMGYLFTLPFTIGLILFFLYPFFQSIVFSLSDLELLREGYELHFIGLENYDFALLIHPEFVRVFTETVLNMLRDVPLIIVFSMFAAIILNQKFKGRTFARMIFFLPVIMGAGIVLRMEMDDYMMSMLESGITEAAGGVGLTHFLMRLQLPEVFLTYIVTAVNNIPEIIRMSGVQILIFLAGLQSIPPSLYEAADVEGATGWESFWMITLPILSPIIFTNIVYTIIDFFTSPYNELVEMISETAFEGAGYGVSTAMSTLYFFAITIILIIAFKIFSNWIFYHE